MKPAILAKFPRRVVNGTDLFKTYPDVTGTIMSG